MNDNKHARDLSVATITEERTQTQNFDVLTPEEEHVLRMRHGLSEDDGHELKFAVGADSETALKLAMMEKYLLENFAIAEMDSFTIDSDHIEAKARILDSLSD